MPEIQYKYMQKLSPERFEEFSQLIGEVQNGIQRLKAKYCTQIGLKPSHVLWLYLLKRHPEGLSASELSEASKVDRSQVSRGIDELFEAEVIKVDDHGDKRRYGNKIRLTEKGYRYAEAITLVVDYIQNELSGDLTPDEVAIFYHVLAIFAERFEVLSRKNEVQEIIDRFFDQDESAAGDA